MHEVWIKKTFVNRYEFFFKRLEGNTVFKYDTTGDFTVSSDGKKCIGDTFVPTSTCLDVPKYCLSVGYHIESL